MFKLFSNKYYVTRTELLRRGIEKNIITNVFTSIANKSSIAKVNVKIEHNIVIRSKPTIQLFWEIGYDLNDLINYIEHYMSYAKLPKNNKWSMMVSVLLKIRADSRADIGIYTLVKKDGVVYYDINL